MYVSLKPMGGTSKLLMMLSSPFPFLSPRPSAFRLVLNSRLSAATVSSVSKHTCSTTSPPRLVNFSINSSPSSQQIHTSVTRDDFHADPSQHPSISTRVSHHWPEWSNLVENLGLRGYFDRQVLELNGEDALSVFDNIPEEFARAASSCLSFARERPHLLGSLSRRDIEIIVENGSPFLFKSSIDSERRMKSFLGSNLNNELVFERAHMVDLMRLLLSFVYNSVISDRTNLSSGELVESSVRSLLRELAYESRIVQEPYLSASVPKQVPDGYGQALRPLRQNIEMKRGDWICTKCSFMNFARNMECLECNETRPKRQLTGGEWDCPQCNFFNYGKNAVCLRCDCRRPGEDSGSAGGPRFGFEYNSENKVDSLNRRTTSMGQTTGNSQYQQTLGNTGISEQNNLQSIDGLGPGKGLGTSINQNLDRILGRASEGSKSEHVPFKPLPSGMFDKSEQVTNSNDFIADKSKELSNFSKFGDSLPLSRKPVIQTESKEDKDQAEKSERWFKKVAELHDVTDLTSAISDEDFPEIMPMRKGENRFVVSKKKDRSFTSPLHKRRMAMEQTNNSTNFVPFVPFPPDYFAKKDKVPESEAITRKDISGTSGFTPPEIQVVTEKSGEQKTGVLDSGAFKNSMLSAQNQLSREESLDTSFSSKSFNESRGNYSYGMCGGNSSGAANTSFSRKDFSESGENYSYGKLGGNSTAIPNDMGTGSRQSWSSDSWEGNRSIPTSPTGSSTQQSTDAHNATESWKGGFSGKSLEGSLVKEPDPLDMSEEAKAERWFRRAAQIKDISELSQIPDEDFPQIMPMRKGVNRFVVSKRKTPLERRLTSPQYRRNLPIVSSEPVSKENNES